MAFADRVNGLARRVPAWPLYWIGLALPVWLLWRGMNGGLGADPVKAIEHQLGLWGLQLIIAGLCVTPLRRFFGLNLIKFRRAIGVLAFAYVFLHFAAWLALDLGLRWDLALKDIVKRPYVTIGMVGLAVMLPLALTSNDWAVRKLGAPRWRRLQKLAYVAALAGTMHYLWLVKAWPWEPIFYLAGVVALLGLRAIPNKRATRAPIPASADGARKNQHLI